MKKSSNDSDEPEKKDADEPEKKDADEPEAREEAETSAWDEKMRLVVQLWDAGNNAELQKVLTELEKAPKEEEAVHRLVEEYRRRLKPDPIAIGLWVVTLIVFCTLTYLFVLR